MTAERRSLLQDYADTLAPPERLELLHEYAGAMTRAGQRFGNRAGPTVDAPLYDLLPACPRCCDLSEPGATRCHSCGVRLMP